MAAPQPMPGSMTRAQLTGGLVATLVPPVAAGVMRILDRQPLDQPPALGWVVVAACVIAGLSLAAATVALLGGATERRGPLGGAATASGTGALAVGLGLAAVAGASDPLRLPGPGLALAGASSGGLFLICLAFPDRAAGARRARLLAGVAVFELMEALLVAALLAGDGLRGVAGWLLLTGAAAGTLANLASLVVPALRGRTVAGLLPVASSLAALALARPGSADLLPGLLGLALAGGLVAVSAPTSSSTDEVTAPLLAGEPVPLLATEDEAGTADVGATANEGATQDEARELAHELRGTIEELMQARSVITRLRDEISLTGTADPLTGLTARPQILERLAHEVAEAQRYTHPVAVVLLDVDDFGALNAERGRAVGDTVLRELALRLQLRIRAADALGRAGADSFLAILPHADERGAASFTRTLLRRLTGRPVATEAGEVAVTLSAGAALMRPGMVLSAERLLVAAEEALGVARAAGGNRIAFDRLHGLSRVANSHEQRG